MTKQELGKYVGTYVVTRERIPSDRRGEMIPALTDLFVRGMVGDQHFNLHWPGLGGKRAANQIHYTKLFLTAR
jgi:hypothetical protein